MTKQPQRKRRRGSRLLRLFIVSSIVVTMIVTRGFGTLPPNPISYLLRDLVAEMVPPFLVTSINEQLQEIEALPLPVSDEVVELFDQPNALANARTASQAESTAINATAIAQQTDAAATPVAQANTTPNAATSQASAAQAAIAQTAQANIAAATSQAHAAQTATAQANIATATSQAHAAQTATAQANAAAATSQANVAQTATAQANVAAATSQARAAQTATAQTATAQTAIAQTATAQAANTPNAATRTAQTAIAQTATAQAANTPNPATRTAQTAIAQTATAQAANTPNPATRTAQTAIAQTATAQAANTPNPATRTAQTAIAQTATAQAKTTPGASAGAEEEEETLTEGGKKPSATPQATATATPRPKASETPLLPTETATPQPTATNTPPAATATATNTPLPSTVLGPVGQPQHGQLIIGTNTLQYAPAPDFYGLDSFTYTVKGAVIGRAKPRQTLPPVELNTVEDSPPINVPIPPNPTVNEVIVTVNVTVANANDNPQALPDTFMVMENSPTLLNVLANDTYLPDPVETLTIINVTAPAHGAVITTNSSLLYTPTLNYAGADTFNYTLADENGGTAVTTVTLTITNANNPPYFVTSPLITATQDVTYSYVISTSDPDLLYGDSTTLTVLNHPNWLTLNGNTLTGQPGATDIAISNITLMVQDQLGLTATQNFSLTVMNINDAPQFVSLPILTATEDITYSYAISTTDPDLPYGESLVLSLVNAPSWLSLVNHTLTGIPTNNEVGLASVSLMVTDQAGLTTTQSYSLTVLQVNDPPTQTVPLTQTIFDHETLVFSPTLAITDIDANNMPLTVTFAVTQGTLSLSQTTNLTLINGNGTGNLTFSGLLADLNAALLSLSYSPIVNSQSIVELTMTTVDGGQPALSDTDVIAITVQQVNAAPQWTTPLTATLLQNTPLVFSNSLGLSLNDLDAAAGQLQVTMSITAGALSLAQVNGLTFSQGDGLTDTQMSFTGMLTDLNAAMNGLVYSPTLNYIGDTFLQLAANDLGNTGSPGPLTATTTLTLTILPYNHPPTLTLPSPQVITEDLALVLALTQSNTITVSDPDAGANPIQLNLSIMSGTLSLSQLTGLTFTLGDGITDTAMTFTGVMTDLNAALNGLVFSPTLNAQGAITLTVIANDLGHVGFPGPLSVTQTLAISITPMNDAPIVTSTVITISEDVPYITQVVAYDPDGDALTYQWVNFAQFGMATLESSGVLTYIPPINWSGVDTLSYQANDGQANSNNATLTVTVLAVNDAPIFVSTPSLTTYQNVTYTYYITTTDVDGVVTTLSAPTLPTWLTLIDNGNGTGVLTGVASCATPPGIYPVTLLATDGISSSLQSFNITLGKANLVDNTADTVDANATTGNLTLREAIAYSCANDTITFAPALTGSTITLGSELVINKNLTINGTFPVTISGNNAVRVFNIAASATNVTLDSLIIANGNSNPGAGVQIASPLNTVTINNSTIFSNSAAGLAGGIYNNGGTLVVNNSTIANNTSSWDVGGLFNFNGVTTINNSTIANNSAVHFGGGVFNEGTMTINNSTISNNSAPVGGGGVYNWTASTLTLNNNIIANSLSGGDCINGAIIGGATNNLIEDAGNACSLVNGINGNIIGSDPQLGPLRNNGGTTLTMAPSACSPVIDAANTGTALRPDQIGQATSGAAPDIGAFEYQIPNPASPLTVINTNDSGMGSLRDAICLVSAGGTIGFTPALTGSTITLSSELVINKNLTINGNVPIKISGNNAVRIFNLPTGTFNITLNNLTLMNGASIPQFGAAVYNDGNTVTLNNITVMNNTAYNGMVTNWAGTMNINNSTIISNTAPGSSGAGAYNNTGAILNINNSTFVNNSGADGGGLRNWQGTVTIKNSTFSGNSGSTGAGIRNDGTLHLYNTIIANSTAGGDCFNGSTIATNTNNLIEDGSCSPLLAIDPQLNPLQNNGGTTLTMMPSACSPVINAGSATTLTTDQTGNPRVVGGTADIGAVEYQTAPLPTVTVQNNSDAVIAPVGSLREAICVVATGGTVDFAAGLSGQTITLGSFIQLDRSVTITGNVPILISGGGVTRHFRGMAGATIALNGLTLINGYRADGNASSVLNSGSTLTLNNITIRNGTGPAGSAGQVRNVSGILTINNSAILSNTHTGGAAGGVYNSATMTINNSTIAGNVSNDGAGIRNNGGTLSIYNSTIAANTGATAAGAGVYNNGGTVNMYNTVVAYNTGAPDCSGTINTNVNNLIEDGSCSPLLAIDPQLGPLQNNGGTTLTMAPLCSSPVIDAAGAGALTTDQLGQAISNGTRDLGAFEYQQPTPTSPMMVTNTNNSGTGSLRNAICHVSVGGQVEFTPALSGSTITLANTLSVKKSMTINSTNQAITTSGNNTVRVFYIQASATNVTLNSLKVIQGKATESGVNAKGGGVLLDSGSTVVINTSTLMNNSANHAGGAVANNGGNLTINDSTLAFNSVTNDGGAILNTSNGILAINNSTIATNSAGSLGGGLQNYQGTATLKNNTFSGNSASGLGGGGIRNETVSAILHMNNNIIANSPAGGNCRNNLGTISTNVRNLIETGNCSGFITSDPQLGPLQNNGGTTLTMAPTACSPVVNASGAGALATDQTGQAAVGTRDIGAFENRATGTGLMATTVQNKADSGGGTLREAITCIIASGGTITFNPALSGQTITLGGTEIPITKNMTLDATGNPVTVSGANASRVFNIASGLNVTMNWVNITGGNTPGPGGAAAYVDTGSTLTVNDCTISNNTSSAVGGAIQGWLASNINVNRCTFANNSSTQAAGALNTLQAGTITVYDSTFSNNTAPLAGGAIQVGPAGCCATINVYRSLFNGNSVTNGASGVGGAISGDNANITVANSTFINNSTAWKGGAISIGAGTTFNVYNSTFANNTATVAGNHSYQGNGTFNGYNNIFAGGANTQCDRAFGATGGNTNLVEGGDAECPAASQTGSPGLGALAANGGPTQTMIPSGAAALGTGNAATCAAAPVSNQDQRGQARGATCDMGAYETTPLSRPAPIELQQIYLPLLLKK